MIRIIVIATIGALFLCCKTVLLAKMNADMSKGFHTDIMHKVMNAPVNTFFDVTPVGKILVRFSKDLEVFKGGLFWSIVHLMNMIFRVGAVVFFLLYVSPLNIIFLGIITALFAHFTKPYMSADN
jgi:ABC-type multidrug transport system fused ATPase/permease subunit